LRMKILFKSIVTGLLLTTLISFLPFEKRCRDINSEVLRIHILADSDSEYDQNLKLKVRDAILKFTDSLYDNVDSKEEAIVLTENNIPSIIKVAESTLRANGDSSSVSAEVTNMDFNTRYYGDITMPSGNYTALRVKIGSGKGKNWWCVMYPSLCLYTSSDKNNLENKLENSEYEVVSDSEKYQFRFKILEYFDYFCSWFR